MRRVRAPSWFRPTSMGAALLGALFIFGCADQANQPTSPDGDLSAAFGEAGPPQELGPALAAQRAHSDRLMELRDVVGTGVGINDDGEPAVAVYLTRPGAAGVPDRLDDVPVERIVTGLIVAGADPTTRARPAPVGFSVGHPDITAGTYGARVTDGSSTFMLSNNHVLANSNDASLEDPIYQPGPFDGGGADDRIAELAEYEPIDFENDNTMDAAIAAPDHPDSISASTPTDDAYGAPSSTIWGDGDGDGSFDDVTQLLETGVQKYGRTTGLTSGTVEEVNVSVTVCYEPVFPFGCDASADFVDQVSISPGDFSDGGDSGSLIVTDDANVNPVGLLFAGSSTRTLANRIDHVLNRFSVSVDDGSGDDGGNDGGDTNDPPTASFDATCTDLSCEFDGSESSDPDGSISSYDWDFGDDNTGEGEIVNHTYGAGGTYMVTLTVTDDDGATDTESRDVTVEEATTGDIALSVSSQKVRGVRTVDLSWDGASSTDVDVFRDGSLVATTENDGAFTDDLGRGGGGSFTYQVCEAGTSTCSNEATATF